jgi:ATP-dependent 26S proteasome regulatory subunit
MNKSDDETIDPEDILYVINKHIKYKTAARKSYVRTKILKCDMVDDYTQLIYKLYNALENKTIVVEQSQENLEVQRENIKLLKRVDVLESFEKKYNANVIRTQNMREQLNIAHLENERLEIKIKDLQNPNLDNSKCCLDIELSDNEIDEDYDPYNIEYPIKKMKFEDYNGSIREGAMTCYYDEWKEATTDASKIELMEKYKQSMVLNNNTI